MQGGVGGGSGMAIFFFRAGAICFLWQRAEFADVAKRLASFKPITFLG